MLTVHSSPNPKNDLRLSFGGEQNINMNTPTAVNIVSLLGLRYICSAYFASVYMIVALKRVFFLGGGDLFD